MEVFPGRRLLGKQLILWHFYGYELKSSSWHPCSKNQNILSTFFFIFELKLFNFYTNGIVQKQHPFFSVI